MAQNTTWIAVADSAHVTIYAQASPGAALNPVPDGVLDLRAALDKNAASRIAAEIPKDFVALRPDELRVRIADELRP